MRDSQNGRIIKNAIVCMICDDLIESKHTHDFKSCKCGTVYIDGGHEYLRRLGDLDKYIDVSEFGPEEV
jgi:hypothetical protein